MSATWIEAFNRQRARAVAAEADRDQYRAQLVTVEHVVKVLARALARLAPPMLTTEELEAMAIADEYMDP